MGRAGYLGKVRNKTAVIVAGLIFGLVANYVGWVFWIHAASEQTVFSFDPGIVLGIMDEISATGAWSIFGWTPTGAALYIIWAVEGLIILIAALIFTLTALGSQPFCESCNQWTKSTLLSSILAPIHNPAAFVAALESNGLTALIKMKNVSTADNYRTKVQLFTCPQCSNSAYLSIDAIEVSLNDKGEEEIKERNLMENFKLSNSDLVEVKSWAGRLSNQVSV